MKIMILVNKNFEYAGYVEGVEARIKADKTKRLQVVSRIKETTEKFSPLCLYELETKTGEKHTISEYCINNFFDDEKQSSNSKNKYDLLMNLFSKFEPGDLPDYIISVSTSEDANYLPIGRIEDKSVNGCVYMGTKFFANDCRNLDDPPRQSNLDIKKQYLESRQIFGNFYSEVQKHKKELATGMVELPNYPANELECIANSNGICLGVINIINYNCYPQADKMTGYAFEDYNKKRTKEERLEPVGIETTHAVVRMAAEKYNIPVLFVSPIVDRFGYFKDDVQTNWGVQNHKGSYNAGVVVANMLQCFWDKFPINFKEEEQ